MIHYNRLKLGSKLPIGFLIFLVSIFLFSSISDIYVNAMPDDLEISGDEFNPREFLSKIISSLETEAIYENDHFKGWPERKNGLYESSERWYRGYQLGMAGIADFLLDSYKNGFLESNYLLNNSIQHFIREKENSPKIGIYWGRFANTATAGWLGHRYGTSGILKFLGHAVAEGYADDMDDIISSAFLWLKDKQLEDSSWPMNEGGYITTGREYGSSGIGADLIDLYLFLNNETYLEEAKVIGDWLIDHGQWEQNRLSIPWSPQLLSSEFDDIRLTGFGTGQAGIIDFLINLYNITEIKKYKDAAIGLGYELIELDLGGFWGNGSVSYITKIYYGNNGLTGYFVGASGIAIQLLKIYDITEDITFLKSSARVERYIETLMDENSAVALGIDYQNNRFTGLGMGSAGIALYYLELYERYGLDRHYNAAIKILANLSNLIDTYDIIPVDQEELALGYSFNIENGLAGIGKVLLKLITINKGIHNDDYENIYLTITPSTTYTNYYQTSKSTDSNLQWFYTSSFFILVLVYANVRKYRSKSRY